MAEPNAGRTAATPGSSGTPVPATPTELGRGSWLAAGKRSIQEFKDDFLQDRAAALTYYGVQSIFPALLVLVSLLGLLGKSATQPLITNLDRGGARSGPADHPQRHRPTCSRATPPRACSLSWRSLSACGRRPATSPAFMRASNAIYDVPEGRPVWKTMPLRLGVTLVLIVLLAASALIVVVTGGLARHVGQVLGVGSAAVTAWDIAKWPVLLIIFSLMLAILYWAAPNAKHGLPVGQPGRDPGRRALAHRLRAVRALRGQLRPLQQGLRQHRRRDHLPDLDVDLQRRDPARRRVQRRARARARDGRRATQPTRSRSSSCATPRSSARRSSAAPRSVPTTSRPVLR